MADPSPSSVAPATPSTAEKVAAWFDTALGYLKIKTMPFATGVAVGFFAPKLLAFFL